MKTMKTLSKHITEAFQKQLAYSNLEWNEMLEDYKFSKEEISLAKKYANDCMTDTGNIPDIHEQRQIILDWSKDKTSKQARKFFHDSTTCFIMFEQFILRAWNKNKTSID